MSLRSCVVNNEDARRQGSMTTCAVRLLLFIIADQVMCTVQEHVQAAHFVCFNLGFFPGGDRSIITKPATTVAAIEAAMDILLPRGIISVMAYVGHQGELLHWISCG
jgi:hypothetical protein